MGVETGEVFGGWSGETIGLDGGETFGAGDVTGADLGATFAGGWVEMEGDATTVGGCVMTNGVAVGVVGSDLDGAVAGAWALNPSRQLRLSKVRTQDIVAIVVCEYKRYFVSYLLAMVKKIGRNVRHRPSVEGGM